MSQPIKWIHKPGSAVPYKSDDKKYSVGVNFHAMYQAIKCGSGSAKPIGPMCASPEEACKHAEADALAVAA